MKTEDFDEFMESGNPLKNRKNIIISLIIIIIGVLLFSFKFVGRILPLNTIIYDSIEYREEAGALNSVWEKDNQLIIIFTYAPTTYDLYDQDTEVKVYGEPLDNLYNTDDFPDFERGLKSVGFSEVSVFWYKILNYFLIVGLLVMVFGIYRMFVNPRRRVNREEMDTLRGKARQQAVELTQTHRRF
jgi:small-conductance mechanosensitive channel